MMRENPEVCFEVEQVDNLASWRSVIAWGTYEELHGSEAKKAMGLLVERVMPLMASPLPTSPTLKRNYFKDRSTNPHRKLSSSAST